MRREEITNREQNHYLLNIEDILVDKSEFARTITVNGAREEGGHIVLSGAQTFSVPYADDICKWNVDGYTIEMDCLARQSITGHGNHGTFVCQGNNPGDIDYWSFGIVKQRLSFYYYNGSQTSVTGDTIMPLNEWHNVKMTYKNNEIDIFIDNKPEKHAVVIGTPQFSSAYNLVFMGYGASTDNVNLKNIRIYKN